MAKLIITRSKEYMNRLRGIGVYINGKEMGKIANGQVREIELPAGDYLLDAKIDWCGSNKFQFHVSEKDTKEVTLTSFGFSWHFIPISFTLLAITFVLQFVLNVAYAGLIGIGVL